MPDSRLNNKIRRLEDSAGLQFRIPAFCTWLLLFVCGRDRFGLWGAFDEPHVAWGTFARFVAYTGKLNWLLPRAAVPPLAILVTCAETLLGIL